MADWLKGYWKARLALVYYGWPSDMFEIRSVEQGAPRSIWQLWEYILNPCPSGHTKHAGRGQATDGTSIPCPGCEFMLSRLWISIHIHLFGRLTAVPCGQALYAIYGWAKLERLKHSFIWNCWNAHLAASKRLCSKALKHPGETLLKHSSASCVSFPSLHFPPSSTAFPLSSAVPQSLFAVASLRVLQRYPAL